MAAASSNNPHGLTASEFALARKIAYLLDAFGSDTRLKIWFTVRLLLGDD